MVRDRFPAAGGFENEETCELRRNLFEVLKIVAGS